MEPDFQNYQGPIPLFPLSDAVLFPHTVLPLHVFEPRYIRLVEDAMKDSGLIGMVRLEAAQSTDSVGDPPVRRVGCVGRIRDCQRLPDGRFHLRLLGLRKFAILRETKKRPYRAARVELTMDLNEDEIGKQADASVRLLLHLLQTNALACGETPPAAEAVKDGLPYAGRVNLLASLSRLTADEAQDLLEERDVRLRARALEQSLRGRIDARSWAECWRGLAPAEPDRN